MNTTFLTTDLARLFESNRESVRQVLEEWERQTGQVITRGPSKERVVPAVLGNLVGKVLEYRKEKKVSVSEAVAFFLKEQEFQPVDPVRDAVREELGDLRQLVLKEIQRSVLPLSEAIEQKAGEILDAVDDRVEDLLGSDDVEGVQDVIGSAFAVGERQLQVVSGRNQQALQQVVESAKQEMRTANIALVKQVTDGVMEEIQKHQKGIPVDVFWTVVGCVGGLCLALGVVFGWKFL